MTRYMRDGQRVTGFLTLDGKVPAGAAVPSGPAGGDLVGSYPDPIVRAWYAEDVILVQTEADLPTPVGGIITIPTGAAYYLTTFVTLTAGIRMLLEPDSVLTGPGAQTGGLIGDVDGPLFSGTLNFDRILLENINLGASSRLMDQSGPAFSTIEFVEMKGLRLGNIANIAGTQWVTVLVNGFSEGLKIDGQIGQIQFVNVTVANSAAPIIAFDVLATAVVLGAANWKNCSIITADPSDRMIRISDAATLPGGVAPTSDVGVQINGNTLLGPGSIIEEGVGFVGTRALSVWSVGNGNLRDSGVAGIARFFDSSVPIVQNYGGVGTWVVMETDNGVDQIVLDADSERFQLIWNSTQDWYLEYNGPQKLVDFTIEWGVDVESVSSTNDLEFRVTRQIGGVGGWVDIVSSHSILQQQNKKNNATGFGRISASPGDQYRLEVRPIGASNNSNVYKVYLSLIL